MRRIFINPLAAVIGRCQLTLRRTANLRLSDFFILFFFFVLTTLYVHSSLENKHPGSQRREASAHFDKRRYQSSKSEFNDGIRLQRVHLSPSPHAEGDAASLRLNPCLKLPDSKTYGACMYSWTSKRCCLDLCSVLREKGGGDLRSRTGGFPAGKLSALCSVFCELIPTHFTTNHPITHSQVRQQDPVSSASAFLSPPRCVF